MRSAGSWKASVTLPRTYSLGTSTRAARAASWRAWAVMRAAAPGPTNSGPSM